MIPVRNRLTYLEQTLRSVLSQDPGRAEMQIEVIDNSTTDAGVAEFVRHIGGDRVDYFRQPQHLEIAENWNTCIERSRGELVHLLHDDDYLAAGFYADFTRLAEEHPQAGLLACRCLIVDEGGEIDRLSDRVAGFESGAPNLTPLLYENPLRCPGVVVRRDAYEACGGFQLDLTFTTDWEMWVRVIERSGVAFLNRPLAFYRLCATSMTSDPRRVAENIRDYLRLADVLAARHPEFDRRRFNRGLSQMTLPRAIECEAAGHTAAARESGIL